MKIEVRADHVLIDGYVNAVGRDSKAIPDRRGAYIEQVVPGAFDRALSKGSTVELRLNHERVLGSTADGSLELREDNIGLRATAKVTDSEVIAKAREKKLRGWSFGFKKIADEWEERSDAPSRRYLKDIMLREVTILDDTKSPAYIATSIELRNEEEEIVEHRSIEDEVEYSIEETEAKEREIGTPKNLAPYRARRLKLS